MKWGRVVSLFALCGSLCAAQALHCNLDSYKSIAGVNVTTNSGSVDLTWPGQQGQELRARFTLRNGQPLIEELAARKPGGAWVALGKDLTPDFQVTTGRRRISASSSSSTSPATGRSRSTTTNPCRLKW